MQWQPVAEGPDERTEVSEITGRGCLVRTVVRGQDGRWTPTAMCFCPGVTAKELGSSAPAPAPAPVVAAPPPAPAAAPTETSVQPAPAPEPAAPPAEPAAAAVEPPPAPAPAPKPAAPVDDLMVVIREFATMRNAVIGMFRSKVGVSNGPLGFLDNAPKVGSMGVPGFGDWVWRIDPESATLRSKNKVIQLGLPDHARDDAFDGELLAAHLGLTNRTQVGHAGNAYPGDAATLNRLIAELEQAKLVRVFSKQPSVTFILK